LENGIMANGFEQLGTVLAGGIDREGAFQQGRYRSAQTEQALAQAAKSQADAKHAERLNNLADILLSAPPDSRNLSDQNKIDLAIGGYGGQYSSAGEAALKGQELTLRERMANPGTTAEELQRLRAATGSTPFNTLDAVGPRGAFSDASHPELGIQKPLGETMFPVDPSNAKKMYDEYVRLGGEGGAKTFSRFAVPDNIVNAGGVPTARNRITNDTTQVVPTDVAATNAGALAGAKTTAQGMAKRTLDIPAAKARLATTETKLDNLQSAVEKLSGNEALWKAVGVGKAISLIPGTQGAYLRAQINTIKSKVASAVLQDMRDNSKTGGALGNVSNADIQFLKENMAALDNNLSPEAFREQLQIVLDFVKSTKGSHRQAFLDTYPELAGAQRAVSPATERVPSFATEAEAEAAGIQPGTRVMIGGKSGVWQ
jgi:hypothetical protein